MTYCHFKLCLALYLQLSQPPTTSAKIPHYFVIACRQGMHIFSIHHVNGSYAHHCDVMQPSKLFFELLRTNWLACILVAVSMVVAVLFYRSTVTAKLNRFKDKCLSSSDSITIDEIKLAITYVKPSDLETAVLLCEAMCSIARYGGSRGCKKIASAGGIPVIVQLLAGFLFSWHAAYVASGALHALAKNGSAAVKAEVLMQRRIIELLEAASRRHFTSSSVILPDRAADTLQLLYEWSNGRHVCAGLSMRVLKW